MGGEVASHEFAVGEKALPFPSASYQECTLCAVKEVAIAEKMY